MVTPRSDAASPDDVRRRKIEQLTAEVRRNVERKIAERSQLGFSIKLSRDVDETLSDPDLKDGASVALNMLLEEYREAGWAVTFTESFPTGTIDFQ